jgi:nitronate monooxygenase
VANAGGLGGCGAVLMTPTAIRDWVSEMRAGSHGPFQINLWVPGPVPHRNAAAEEAVCFFLSQWGPSVTPKAGDAQPPDFAAQCEALLEASPSIISSIMGLYPPTFVAAMKARAIRWFANATTVAEARAAEQAGADAIVAQGMEAGGHRGAFDPARAESEMVGLFSRGVAAALALGASAVQVGTGFLRCPEADSPSAWADAIGTTLPEQTIVTRAFSGRPGRAIATAYALAATSPSAPAPAPYPVQRGLTKAMREAAVKSNDINRLQAWAGQSAALSVPRPAAEVVRGLWEGAQAILG